MQAQKDLGTTMRNDQTRNLRSRTLIVTGLLPLTLVAVGCGPISFAGTSPLAVMGDPPPPPEPPPPEPPPEPKRVEVRDNKIVINEKIQFEFNKAIIKEVSFDLLAEVAKVITEHPHIKKIQIEGHASAEGDDNYNLKLSDKRAKAVADHLVKKGGIKKEMLIAKGFGETVPLGSNDTEEGREQNRRVEFNIIEQDYTQKKVEVDPKTGQETVVEEKAVSTTPPPAPPAPPAPPSGQG